MVANVFQRIMRRLGAPRLPQDRRTLKDRALARRLRAAFEEDLEFADVDGLHFYVQNSAVTIYGTVRHDLNRELLTSFVRQIPGVRNVVPHLTTVEGLPQTPSSRHSPSKQPSKQPSKRSTPESSTSKGSASKDAASRPSPSNDLSTKDSEAEGSVVKESTFKDSAAQLINSSSSPVAERLTPESPLAAIYD